MSLTLDPALEQRIQRVVDAGTFRGPAEVLSHALDLIEAEAHGEDWLICNKAAVNSMLDESFAEAARGEGLSPEEARAQLAQWRVEKETRAA